MSIKLYANVDLLAIPTDPEHIVNRRYVDLLISGKLKNSVRVVNIEDFAGTYDATTKTLTQTTPAEMTIDEIAIAAGDRILLAGQLDLKQNGIYEVTTAGSATDAAILTRADDFDDADDVFLNVVIPIREGKKFADTTWTLTNDTIPVIDTDDLFFAQGSGAGGAKSYTETFTGDGVTKDFDIVHEFDNMNVSVTVLESATKEKVNFDVIIKDSNTVTIHSDTLLTAEDSFDVIVIG